MNILKVKSILKEMVKKDQEVRSTYPKKNDEMDKLDIKHGKFMEKIISNFGVIDIKRFGKETAREAVLLIQHTNHKLRKKYVELQSKLPLDNIYTRGYVYMIDRVLIEENKPQLYGTQLKLLDESGTLAFNPIEDIENIDKRRAEMGLESFNDYVKNVENSTGKKPEILKS